MTSFDENVEKIGYTNKTYPVLAKSNETMGFKVEQDPDVWINFDKSLVSVADMKERVKEVNYGDVLVFMMPDEKHYSDFKVKEKSDFKSQKSSGSFIDDNDRFDNVLKEFNDKYPNYHKVTEVLEHDREKQFALVKVTLTLPVVKNKEESFRSISALGDAAEDSIKTKMILPHYIRMAETRAFARAMRFILAKEVIEEEK